MSLYDNEALKEAAQEAGLNVGRMEEAADKIIAAATELGVTRTELISVCLAIGANHMIAIGLSRERAALAVGGMYEWRASVGMDERALVPDGGCDGVARVHGDRN